MEIEFRAEVIGSMMRPAYLKAIRFTKPRGRRNFDWSTKSRIACGDEPRTAGENRDCGLKLSHKR
jgi:hypothetical protein